MKKIFSLITIIIVIASCLCVFPLNLLRMEYRISSGDTEPYGKTPSLNPGCICTQSFIAQEAYLKELSFAFSPVDILAEDTTVLFEFLDSDMKVLASKVYNATAIIDENYCTIPINKWLKKGNLYTYKLSVSGSTGNQLVLYTTPNSSNFALGNTILSLNGVALEGQAYNLYLYTQPLSKKNILCTWAFIWIIGMSVYSIIDRYIINRSKKFAET